MSPGKRTGVRMPFHSYSRGLCRLRDVRLTSTPMEVLMAVTSKRSLPRGSVGNRAVTSTSTVVLMEPMWKRFSSRGKLGAERLDFGILVIVKELELCLFRDVRIEIGRRNPCHVGAALGSCVPSPDAWYMHNPMLFEEPPLRAPAPARGTQEPAKPGTYVASRKHLRQTGLHSSSPVAAHPKLEQFPWRSG